MENTKIEWATHTFNPWVGCTKVSPGCAHCYAEAQNKRWKQGANWGKGAPRSRTSPANWAKPLRWNAIVENERQNEIDLGPSRAGKMPRPRVFCASLADWLDEEVPIEWLADLLALIHATPNLDWLLLTKRPENWLRRVSSAWNFLAGESSDDQPEHEWVEAWLVDGKAPSNVWIGTTAEDQTRADERIPKLLEIPARIRFLSCEPLLSPVLLWPWIGRTEARGYGKGAGIHWVIAGGESGHGARPMHPLWAEGLRAQCSEAGVAFFMKQMGGTRDSRHALADIPPDLRIREFPQ